jgi:GT2 family glycosyltransferase
MSPRISFVIVNFNTASHLSTCISHIEKHCKEFAEIIVVDNASTDESCKIVSTEFPDANLIANQTNVGYPAGVNIGIKYASTEFIFILNSDVYLHKNTTTFLLECLHSQDKIGIVGPAQFLPNGESILPIYQNPTLLRELGRHLFFFDVIRYRILKNRILAKHNINSSVDWLMGAALLVKKAVIENIGLFDENVFMYGEEFDWQFRAKKQGWKVYYVPSAHITHDKSASATKAFSSSRLAIITKSNLYFRAKLYGYPRLFLDMLLHTIGSCLRIFLYLPVLIISPMNFYNQSKKHLRSIQISTSANTIKWIKTSLESNEPLGRHDEAPGN